MVDMNCGQWPRIMHHPAFGTRIRTSSLYPASQFLVTNNQNRRINHIVSVDGKMWLMEAMAAARYPDKIAIIDTVMSFCYKTRIARGNNGQQYRVYIDNSVAFHDSM